MSSVYRRICLSHTPPLELDEEVSSTVPPETHPEHPHCTIALGRYSYPLVEVWLPDPNFDKDGHPHGRWYDPRWIRQYRWLCTLFGEETRA